MDTAIGLLKLLGLEDPQQVDPLVSWQRRSPQDELRVPIGIATDGSPVILDLREPAQAGMGPHGLIVGATGSGKSELLRTIILALAMTHSPYSVNFAALDYMGGASFFIVDKLPHTSAVITNLAEADLRLRQTIDSINAELLRRQGLLRAAGSFGSRLEYERARAAGAQLAPFPVLLLVVDEFTELLHASPDILEVLLKVGRVGRALGVHMLLASQRIEEGRMRGLERHLSYRIGMRTFSAAESRLALGVPDAYELPSSPGHAYLKVGSEPLIRFRGAYTSEPWPPQRPDPDFFSWSSVFETVVNRLHGQAYPAHQMWLPDQR